MSGLSGKENTLKKGEIASQDKRGWREKLGRVRKKKYYVEALAAIVLISGIAGTLLVTNQQSGRWAWEPATVVNDGPRMVIINDLESRTMTYHELTNMSYSMLEDLNAQVAEHKDTGVKLAVFWGKFCYWWYESAGFITPEYHSDSNRPYPPYEIYWKGAEKLYGELYHHFRDEYGTDKPLPKFINAQQAACMVI